MLVYQGCIIKHQTEWLGDLVYRVIITQPTGGTISTEEFVYPGDTVTLDNTPDTGYQFDHYTIDGEPLQGNTFTMPEHDVEISGVFTQITYTITVNSGSHGTITAPVSAHYGDTITLTGTVDDGYALDHYTVNGTPITGNTFTMPASNAVISAEYYARTYSISKTNPSGGTITVPSSAVYGSTVTISISTTADWELNYFTVDGVQISGNSFTMPAHNVTVSAVLKAATRTYRSDFIFISPYSQFNTCYDLSALAAGSGVSVNMYVWVYDGLLDNGSWKRWSRYGDSQNVNCSIGSMSPFTLTDSNKNVLTVNHTSDPYTVAGTYVRFEFSADHDIQLYLSNFRQEFHASTGSVTARYYTGNYDRTGSPGQTGMTTVYTADPFIIGTKKV